MPNGYKQSFSTPPAGAVPLFDRGESRWGSLLAETRPGSLTASVQTDTSWGEIHYGFGHRGLQAGASARDADDIDQLVRECAAYAAGHGGQVDGTLFLDLDDCR